MRFLRIFVILALACVSTANKKNGTNRLIKLNKDSQGVWMTRADVWKLLKSKTKFVDITTSQKIFPTSRHVVDTSASIPKSLKYQSLIKPMFDLHSGIIFEAQNSLNINLIRLVHTFHTRFWDAENWAASQKLVVSIATDYLDGIKAKTSVKQVGSGSFQKNVIARIEGKDPGLKSQVIVLGAHYDSVNYDGGTACAPGADDNASGSATLMEVLRLLQGMMIKNKVFLKRTVEFHWYTAEEIGLVGSGEVAQLYKTDGVNVVGMANFDVVGYQQNGEKIIGIYTDEGDTNPALTDFMRLLVKEYSEYKSVDKKCGYACSDHASWARFGYPSTFLAEPVFNPNIHSIKDTMDDVTVPQVIEFVKVAFAFVIELGEIA